MGSVVRSRGATGAPTWSDYPAADRLERWTRAALGVVDTPSMPSERLAIPLPTSASAEDIAARLVRDRGSVWLDGGDSGEHLIAWAPRAVLSASGAESTLDGSFGIKTLDADGFGLLAAAQIAWGTTGARLFGYLGYELGGRLESVPLEPAAVGDLPDLWLTLHDAWLQGSDGDWKLVASTAWRTVEEIHELRSMLLRLLAGRGREETPAASVPCVAVPDRPGFEHAVARTVARIRAGEIFQANLCRRYVTAFDPADRWHLYMRMRRHNPAQYGAFLQLGDAAVLSMSPECFLRLRGRQVHSTPIKGTRARGAGSVADDRLAAELLASDKDRAELAMIVDLVRNDLGRVCVGGSVEVLEHAALMRLPTLMHTYSRVRGRLRDDATAVHLLRAAFPAGSITGAPKIQAMVVAAGEEACRRGPAMGSIGWIDPNGDLLLSVAIRTAVVAGEQVVYHAGCGIVADSDPRSERDEARLKAGAFLAALAGRG